MNVYIAVVELNTNYVTSVDDRLRAYLDAMVEAGIAFRGTVIRSAVFENVKEGMLPALAAAAFHGQSHDSSR